MAEVEVLCPRKLQRALTFTDAELEDEGELVRDFDVDARMNQLKLGEVSIFLHVDA